MNQTEYNKAHVVKYLIWTFVIAYLIQAGVALLYHSGYAIIGQLAMSLMMFVPLLGVLLSGSKLSGMGWKLQLKRNILVILIAWLGPAVLTFAGAALYYLIFPGHLDLSGSTMDPNVLRQLEAQGITYPLYILITAVSGVTYGPLINTFVALGEEIGWRGFLYPQLKARFGRTAGRVLGGAIWGAWHWPIIWLIGYEYGDAYFGYPVVGMLLFCVITVALGILCDWVYEKSGSIWLPSLCHGAINAVAGIPLAVCVADIGSARLLGPAPNGLIAGLPYLAVAVILFLCTKNSRSDAPADVETTG